MRLAGHVDELHRVRIFTRPLSTETHVVVVEFSYCSDKPNEVTLLFPGKTAIWHSLFYPPFFAHLNRVFLSPNTKPAVQIPHRVKQLQRPLVKKHEVDNAFVFKLPAGWWRTIPMFFIYKPDKPESMWFPTFRCTYGEPVAEKLQWDNWVYCQGLMPDAYKDWRFERSNFPAGVTIRKDYANGMVDEHSNILRAYIGGVQQNADMLLLGHEDKAWFLGNEWEKEKGDPIDVTDQLLASELPTFAGDEDDGD